MKINSFIFPTKMLRLFENIFTPPGQRYYYKDSSHPLHHDQEQKNSELVVYHNGYGINVNCNCSSQHDMFCDDDHC